MTTFQTMKRRDFIQLAGGSALVCSNPDLSSFSSSDTTKHLLKKKMFLYGGDFNEKFIRYVASLTGKNFPKICFLPTASGDSHAYIELWLKACSALPIRPLIQPVFISSRSQILSFHDVFLNMDAIMVGGGNTLNMLAIWKAQGIDMALKNAWEHGVILSGGSAGSLCWFEQGLTDSRPIDITTVEGLGFLEGSHCPHYDTEKERKPLYFAHIKNKRFKPGYGCDERAGMYFEDNDLKRVISLNETSNVYSISLTNGIVTEKELPKEVLS